MITKERLEELIEQGATIYHLIAKNYEEINVNDIPQYKIDKWELYKEYYFETKEDARWELEMTATRTETLKLPTWEEFVKDEYFDFIAKDNTIWEVYKHLERPSIYVINGYKHYEFDFTKENYIEVCKLCLRLFKGEEV